MKHIILWCIVDYLQNVYVMMFVLMLWVCALKSHLMLMSMMTHFVVF